MHRHRCSVGFVEAEMQETGVKLVVMYQVAKAVLVVTYQVAKAVMVVTHQVAKATLAMDQHCHILPKN